MLRGRGWNFFHNEKFGSALKVTMLGKCVLTVLELNWNQRFRGKKVGEIEHLSSYAHIFHTNSSCHIAERTRMSAKFPKIIYF